MSCNDPSFPVEKFAPFLLDAIPAAVTVIDLDGHVLYFNDYAAEILDRKGEHIGRDLRLCHGTKSVKAVDHMIEAFKNGRKKPFQWESQAPTRVSTVTLLPLALDSQRTVLVQTVTVKEWL